MSLTDTVTTRIPDELPAPVYAAVGVADAAVHEARHVPVRFESVRKDVETSTSALREDLTKRLDAVREEVVGRARDAQDAVKTQQDKATETVHDLPTSVREYANEHFSSLAARVETLPADTRARYLEMIEELKKQYKAYAGRGEKVVTTIRTSEATVEAEHQVKAAASKAKAAQTTVRKATAQTTKARKAAATSARKAAEAVVEAAEDAAETIGK